MAKNVTIAGASYTDVPAVDLPQTGGGTATFTDVSDTTAQAADVAQGKQFFDALGVLTQGTASGGGTLITKTITQNGTYNAEDDDADGYSEVTVNVSGGGGASSWTKVAEKTFQYSTTDSTTQTVETWATGHPELWTADKIVWVRILDTEGKRNNYFYGSDSILFNANAANGSMTKITFVTRRYAYYQSDGFTGGNSTYGIWCSALSASGDITIQARYNSSSSRTINSTYKIEVYLLDPAGGISPFA